MTSLASERRLYAYRWQCLTEEGSVSNAAVHFAVQKRMSLHTDSMVNLYPSSKQK